MYAMRRKCQYRALPVLLHRGGCRQRVGKVYRVTIDCYETKTIKHRGSECHMHARVMWHSLNLLDYPVIGRLFATTRAGSTRASKPDIFGMGAVFVFTM